MRLASPAASSLALVAACAVALAPAPARPDTPIWNLLTVELLGRSLAQIGISLLRNQVDVEYDRLDILDAGQRYVMTGLAVYPPSPDPSSDEDCVVEIAELDIVSRTEGDRSWTALRAHGAEASLGCLPTPAAGPISALGYDALRFERAELDLDYDFGPSALDARLTLVAAEAASLTVEAGFDYFWVMDDGISGPEPAIWLREASAVLEDGGLAPRLRAMMQGQGEDPAELRAGLAAGLRAALSDGGARPLSAPEQQFAEALASGLHGLLMQGGAVGVQSRPEDGVWLGAEDFQGAGPAFAALQPQVFPGALPPTVRSGPTAETMRRVLSGGDATDEERREVGAALLSGLGAPRAVQAALDLLEPLANAGDPEAAALAADALAERLVAAGLATPTPARPSVMAP
ncbi:MAG: hypothetical protein AAF192_06680, partial [Pseudomonadota bacterium]